MYHKKEQTDIRKKPIIQLRSGDDNMMRSTSGQAIVSILKNVFLHHITNKADSLGVPRNSIQVQQIYKQLIKLNPHPDRTENNNNLRGERRHRERKSCRMVKRNKGIFSPKEAAKTPIFKPTWERTMGAPRDPRLRTRNNIITTHHEVNKSQKKRYVEKLRQTTAARLNLLQRRAQLCKQ